MSTESIFNSSFQGAAMAKKKAKAKSAGSKTKNAPKGSSKKAAAKTKGAKRRTSTKAIRRRGGEQEELGMAGIGRFAGPAGKVYSAAKAGYRAGTMADRAFGLSNKASNLAFRKLGPASPRLIRATD